MSTDAKKLKGTRTEANLMAAFAGESQAHVKYTYYASRAKKDGYVQISKYFEETAPTSASTQRFVCCCTTVSSRPIITCRMRQTASTTSGPTCIRNSPRKL